MNRLPLGVVAIACTLGFAKTAHGQGLDDLREGLRDALQDSHFTGAFAGLIFLSDELELSGARFRFHDDVGTELTTFALPYRTTLHPWGANATGLYFEGVLGYARATQGTPDLYDGALPGYETSVEAAWRTYGGLAGLGLAFELTDEVSLAPILDFGLARIENETSYGGPGAEFSAALLDGLAFNWDGITAAGGGAARLDWEHPLEGGRKITTIGRYDLRWTRTIQADDRAQEFSNRIQLLTLRTDVTGPTGLWPLGHSLGWRTSAGLRHFVEGELFETRYLVHLGGALEVGPERDASGGGSISLIGAVILGEDVVGWSLGFGFSL